MKRKYIKQNRGPLPVKKMYPFHNSDYCQFVILGENVVPSRKRVSHLEEEVQSVNDLEIGRNYVVKEDFKNKHLTGIDDYGEVDRIQIVEVSEDKKSVKIILFANSDREDQKEDMICGLYPPSLCLAPHNNGLWEWKYFLIPEKQE